MSSVMEQIFTGVIVCPKTREKLTSSCSSTFVSTAATYDCVNGVPILLEDPNGAGAYAEASKVMTTEYESAKKPGLIARIRSILIRDFRTLESRSAFREVITNAALRKIV